MKPHLDIAHSGTLTGDRTEMKFDENSIAHLMSVLIDLYSDPVMAVIREYSTNALDAHVAAGETRPIEVETPSSLRPIFVVRDFGIGMSEQTILENFSRYGWSSKRESDEQVGMLGLGCKSALSLTSQFTMVSTHQGLRTTVLITRNENGAGAVQVVESIETDEPNGTEVRIPVPNWTSFSARVVDFFQYWNEGTVLVDGIPPYCIWTDDRSIKLDDDVYFVRKRDNEPNVVVMGNVAYPFKWSDAAVSHDPYGYDWRVVARVSIGSVNFAPSREALFMNERTKLLIVELVKYVRKMVPIRIQERIDACKTGADVLELLNNGRLPDRGLTFMYRWTPIPRYINHSDDDFSWCSMRVVPDTTTRDSAWHSSMMIAGEFAAVKLWVTGFKGRSVPATTKAKIREYCANNGIKDGNVCLVTSVAPFSPWLDESKVVSLDTIRGIQTKAPVAPKAAGYQVPIATTTRDLVMTYDKPDCWIEKEQYPRDLVSILNAVGLKGLKVAVLVPSRRDKFSKVYPDVPKVADYVRAAYLALPERPKDCSWIADHWHLHSILRDNTGIVGRRFQILDPLVQEGITLCRSTSRNARYSSHDWSGLFRALNMKHPRPESDEHTLMTQIMDRYPILGRVNWSYDSSGALVETLNALYITRNQLHLLPVA